MLRIANVLLDGGSTPEWTVCMPIPVRYRSWSPGCWNRSCQLGARRAPLVAHSIYFDPQLEISGASGDWATAGTACEQTSRSLREHAARYPCLRPSRRDVSDSPARLNAWPRAATQRRAPRRLCSAPSRMDALGCERMIWSPASEARRVRAFLLHGTAGLL